MVATYTLFYIVTTWIVSYGTGKVSDASGEKLSFSYSDFLELQILAVLFFAVFVMVSGRMADRFGRRAFLLVVTALIIVFGLCFKWILDPSTMNNGVMLLFLILGMTLMGLTFGPMSAILPELFPTNVRYTGSGISYNVSSIIGAAVAPFIATWIVADFGVGWVGVYLAVAACTTFIALLSVRETKTVDLTQI